MLQQNLTPLKNQLHKLGFSGIFNQVEYYANINIDEFKAYMFVSKGNDRLMYTLDIRKNKNEWMLKSYELVKTTIDIPEFKPRRLPSRDRCA